MNDIEIQYTNELPGIVSKDRGPGRSPHPILQSVMEAADRVPGMWAYTDGTALSSSARPGHTAIGSSYYRTLRKRGYECAGRKVDGTLYLYVRKPV